jgi:hypothetical protein
VVTEALNSSAAVLTAAASGSLSLPAGTAVAVAASVEADALTFVIWAVSAALTSLLPEVTAEARPSISVFRVVVDVHTLPAQAVCSAVGAPPVVESPLLAEADDGDCEGAADGVVLLDVDPPHPARRTAAAIRTSSFLMAFLHFRPHVI